MGATNMARAMTNAEGNEVLKFRPLEDGSQLSLEKVAEDVADDRSRLRLILSRPAEDESQNAVEEIFGGIYADRIPENFCNILYDLTRSAEEFRQASHNIIQDAQKKVEQD